MDSVLDSAVFEEVVVRQPIQECEWLNSDGSQCKRPVVEGTGMACAKHRAEELLFVAEIEAKERGECFPTYTLNCACANVSLLWQCW